MYEDEPQDKVHDDGGRRLRRAPAGTTDHRPGGGGLLVPVPEIAAWHDGRYVPGNIVVAAAGNLEHERIVSLVSDAWATPAAAARAARRTAAPRCCASSRRRPSSTTCTCGPGLPRDDERRFTLRVLDTILGGSTSSRLFQEVREKRGLAYSVYSYRATTPTPGR